MVTELAQERVAIAYINALLQRGKENRIFENMDESMREIRAKLSKLAKKVARESEQLQGFFRSVAGEKADFDSPFNALGSLTEVLGQSEVGMLILDVESLVRKYPDISKDQLTCLLNLRGDLDTKKVKQIVEDSIPKEPKLTLQAKSIFSKFKVEVSTSKNPFGENTLYSKGTDGFNRGLKKIFSKRKIRYFRRRLKSLHYKTLHLE